MSETMTFTGELTIVSCWCGMKHAVPSSLNRHQHYERDHGRDFVIYCPLGHQYVAAGESEVARLKRELEQAKNRTLAEQQRHDQTRAELRETERRRQAQKGVTTRIKNRVQKGVCPCCNRTFTNLARHMAGQHPDFSVKD